MSLTETSRLVLEKVDLFAGMPEGVLRAIHQYLKPQEVDAGTVLFREGGAADCIYIVRSGLVRLTKRLGDDDIELLSRGKGEIIGEMALIDLSPRFTTATCVQPSRLWVLSRARFPEVMRKHPEIAARLLGVLASRVREIDNSYLQRLKAEHHDLDEARTRLESLLQRLQKANVHLESALADRDRILAVSPYAAIVTDAHNRVRLVNPAAHTFFGKSTSKDLWAWITPVDPEVVSAVDRRLSSDERWQGEIEINGPDDKILTCKLICVPIGDRSDDDSARLWMFEDLTEMRQLEQQSLQREHLATKGEMAGEIAHELNNYLAVLSGNVELLSMSLKDSASEKMLKRLQSMSGTVERVRVFTDNLLRSRHPAGEKTTVELNDFLDNQLAFLKPQKRIKKVIIETDWGPDIPPVACDASAMQQVFYNLVINSADALSECGHEQSNVWITTHYDVATNSAVLTVADNGPGIPGPLTNKLFKERVSSKPTGHGFGLLTIARIVRDHKGTVTACNRPEGGAEFTITLPVGSDASL
jgi:nitrogen-specific signal transduction histidine kinase